MTATGTLARDARPQMRSGARPSSEIPSRTGEARWEDHAACKELTGREMDDFHGGTDTDWHSPRVTRADTAQAFERAKQVCYRCAVKIECFQDAIETGADGVRGGLTKTERDNITGKGRNGNGR